MNFEIKQTKDKIKSSYKTLYISDDLVQQILALAKEHDTSFNNVVISMIKSCLESN